MGGVFTNEETMPNEDDVRKVVKMIQVTLVLNNVPPEVAFMALGSMQSAMMAKDMTLEQAELYYDMSKETFIDIWKKKNPSF